MSIARVSLLFLAALILPNSGYTVTLQEAEQTSKETLKGADKIGADSNPYEFNYHCSVNFFEQNIHMTQSSDKVWGGFMTFGSYPIIFAFDKTYYTTGDGSPGNATDFALNEGNKTGIVIAYEGVADKPRKKSKDWIKITLYRREVDHQYEAPPGKINNAGVKSEHLLGSLKVKGNGSAESLIDKYKVQLACTRKLRKK